MPVRIQGLCLEGNSSIRGPLVGQLTWVSGKSHSRRLIALLVAVFLALSVSVLDSN